MLRNGAVGFIDWLDLLRAMSRKLLGQTRTGISENLPPLIQKKSRRSRDQRNIPEHVERQLLCARKINLCATVNPLRVDATCLHFGLSRASPVEVLVQIDVGCERPETHDDQGDDDSFPERGFHLLRDTRSNETKLSDRRRERAWFQVKLF